MKKVFQLILVLALGVVLLFGCAASRAVSQPDKKDLAVLTARTSRDVVLAELGNPVASGKDAEGEYDIFSFIQGYSRGSKSARAFVHGVLDVFTLGLWEIVGTPIEGAASGTKVRIKVFYKEGRVLKFENLTPPPPPKE
ncbi:MAG: hypothetical protein NTV77_00660 [Candidatus Azambacteria bacterium]|nr:hypothetical protein [Candidatus Azambacteria bacterium]